MLQPRQALRELLRNLGADDVIDYTAVRFEDQLHAVDVVLDTVGGDTLERSWSVLRPGGIMVTVAGAASADKAAQYGVRGVDFIVKPSRAELIELARLIEAGKIQPIVEATFPLANAREAFEARTTRTQSREACIAGVWIG